MHEIFGLQNKLMLKSNAIVITAGLLDSNSGKTAHGLIRGTDRFNILAVIDDKQAGKDAGEVLDGKRRNIPIYASIADFAKHHKEKAKYCVIGVATKGGVIPESLRRMLREALEHGMGLVNGLHEHISEVPELANLARKKTWRSLTCENPSGLKTCTSGRASSKVFTAPR